ncbi:HlyD family secretion protein [Pseudoalteromonas spongiae]|uniref:HlyD family efflux transporter periplasmic adaptor subunit n=1 Tax=Pseudoalteromonas spongiae TaxID=298657 RepID=A0ABU8ETW4_9GAMM
MKAWLSLLVFVLLAGCSDEHSVALGTLERDRITHSATVNEVLIALPIERGSMVKQGDVLAQLDNTKQLARVAKVKADLESANAHFIKLKNGAREEEVARAQATLAANKANLVEARQNYHRVVEIVAKDLAPKISLDSAKANLDAATANVEAAKQQLTELTNGTRVEDLQVAAANVKAQQALLSAEEKLLSELNITATRDGLLDNLPWNLGERVTLGSPVAIVLAGEAPFARIYLPQQARAKLKVGDSLTLTIAEQSEQINGTVRWLSHEAAFTPYYGLNQYDRTRLMYLAEVQLPPKYKDLPSGLPVEARYHE